MIFQKTKKTDFNESDPFFQPGFGDNLSTELSLANLPSVLSFTNYI